MHDFQACIFDVFGTVVDWRNSVARMAEAQFAAKGVEIDALDDAEKWQLNAAWEQLNP